MSRAPLATYALVALNVAVFAYELLLPSAAAREGTIDAFALIPFDLTHGVALAAPAPPAALTLLTSQFLHGSVPHLAFNMLFLLLFGPDVELEAGHARFLLAYLACGALGGLAQVSIAPGSHVPDIGASGAIAGVLGAYAVRFPTRHLLHVPAVALIAVWAATQFVHGFGALSDRVLSEQGGGTAYFSHIGGFLAGVFAGAAFRPRPRRPRGAGAARAMF